MIWGGEHNSMHNDKADGNPELCFRDHGLVGWSRTSLHIVQYFSCSRPCGELLVWGWLLLARWAVVELLTTEQAVL